MKLFLTSALAILLASVNGTILAQQQTGITREVEVGALFTSGNTDNQALNFAGSVETVSYTHLTLPTILLV